MSGAGPEAVLVKGGGLVRGRCGLSWVWAEKGRQGPRQGLGQPEEGVGATPIHLKSKQEGRNFPPSRPVVTTAHSCFGFVDSCDAFNQKEREKKAVKFCFGTILC